MKYVTHFTLEKNIKSILADGYLSAEKVIHPGLGELGKGQFAFLDFDTKDTLLIKKFMKNYIKLKNAKILSQMGYRRYLNRDAVCLVFDFENENWKITNIPKIKQSDFQNSTFSSSEIERFGYYIMSPVDVRIPFNDNFNIIRYSEILK